MSLITGRPEPSTHVMTVAKLKTLLDKLDDDLFIIDSQDGSRHVEIWQGFAHPKAAASWEGGYQGFIDFMDEKIQWAGPETSTYTGE